MKNETAKIFRDRFKALRLQNNLSKYELAKELEISDSTITRWENGERIPNIIYLNAICKYFNESADYLIGITD